MGSPGRRATRTEEFVKPAWQKAIGRVPPVTSPSRRWSSALGYVTARPATTEPRSATDAASSTPCDVRPHGHGSGWKHAAVPRDNVRSWSRSARKSRPPSGNGQTTMRTDTSHRPNPACQGLPRWTPSVSSFHMPKLLNPSNSRKKNVAMDTNIWPWAYAVAQNVQRNGWNINVHIAM